VVDLEVRPESWFIHKGAGYKGKEGRCPDLKWDMNSVPLESNGGERITRRGGVVSRGEHVIIWNCGKFGKKNRGTGKTPVLYENPWIVNSKRGNHKRRGKSLGPVPQFDGRGGALVKHRRESGPRVFVKMTEGSWTGWSGQKGGN